MIWFEPDDWASQIFRFAGTVWSDIWWKVLLLCLYTTAAYVWCDHSKMNLGISKTNILGPTLSCILVFRVNNAYARFWQGRSLLTPFFSQLREIVSVGIMAMQGGDFAYQWKWRHRTHPDKDFHGDARSLANFINHSDLVASEERVDIIRWCLVVAISFHLHTIILQDVEDGTMSARTKWLADWSRYRIRCLTTAVEFREMDKHVRSLAIPATLWDDRPMEDLAKAAAEFESGEPDGLEMEVSTDPRIRLPVAATYKLNDIICRGMRDDRAQAIPTGLLERFVPLMVGLTKKLLTDLSLMSQIVVTPLPFSYFHLCKTMLFAYFLSFPFLIDYTVGLWANLGELCLLSIALFGVDAIATELENPFGDDDNDLDIYQKISQLEHEVMLFLKLIGDENAERAFVWRDMPAVLTKQCLSPIPSYLALRTQIETNGRDPDCFHGKRVDRRGHRQAHHKHHEHEEEELDDEDDGDDE